jgi:hypothetical protein
MKILKLSDNEFLMEFEGQSMVLVWQSLLEHIDTSIDKLNKQDPVTIDSFEIMEQLAQYKNGATWKL